MNYNDDEDYMEIEDNDLLSSFVLPPDLDEERVVLQIIGHGGEIKDVLFELEEIYKYVVNVYKNSPKGN